MDITKFVEQSLGCWHSQRSAHHMAFRHFEEVTSTIQIQPLEKDDPDVLNICQVHNINPQTITHPFRMSWEGESDWDENEVLAGTTILIPVPDPSNHNRGQLLREQGYAETIPAIGQYHITDEGTFILTTQYQQSTAEERIWFASPNVRFRVSLIKTSDGTGVVTPSFSSEIRALSADSDQNS